MKFEYYALISLEILIKSGLKYAIICLHLLPAALAATAFFEWLVKGIHTDLKGAEQVWRTLDKVNNLPVNPDKPILRDGCCCSVSLTID